MPHARQKHRPVLSKAELTGAVKRDEGKAVGMFIKIITL